MCHILGATVGTLFFSMLVVHEQGHLIIARKLGYETQGMVVIPFIGAIGFLKEEVQSNRDEAIIALAGPLVGLVFNIILLVAWLLTLSPALQTVVWINAMVNLFNLLPIFPLDGGRVARVILRSMNMDASVLLSLSVIIAVIMIIKHPIFLLLALMARQALRQHCFLSSLSNQTTALAEIKASAENDHDPEAMSLIHQVDSFRASQSAPCLSQREISITVTAYLLACICLISMVVAVSLPH
jgi:Zn-dependent protease